MGSTAEKRPDGYLINGSERVDLGGAWSMPWHELADCVVSPVSANAGREECKKTQSLVSDDIWTMPEAWLPITKRTLGNRLIDFNRAVPATFSVEKAEGLKRRIKRLALLSRTQTVRLGNRQRSPGRIVTWVQQIQLLCRAARSSLENFNPEQRRSSCPDGPTIFASLSPTQVQALGKKHFSWLNGSVFYLNAFLENDLFDDWPSSEVAKPNRVPQPDSKRSSDPFSDEAFTEIVQAALWLSSIQHEVLEAYLSISRVRFDDRGNYGDEKLKVYRKKLLAQWESDSLWPGAELQKTLKIDGAKKRIRQYTHWPPDTLQGLKVLLGLCQTANAVLVLTCGVRYEEMLTLKLDCTGEFDGRSFLTGREFKSEDAVEGRVRDWPLPIRAAEAIKRQKSFAEAMGSRDSLWVPFSTRERSGSGLPGLGAQLVLFGERIGTKNGQLLQSIDGKISPYRFRYTFARLVALSLLNYSQVLFDVLGHEDQETTLGYAHRDPELVEDIEKIKREAKAVRSKEILSDIESTGGPASQFLKDRKSEMLVRVAKDELDSDDLVEMSHLLGDFEVVRLGIVCIAQPLERGACTSKSGMRDVSNCSSGCLHRLELSAEMQNKRKKHQYFMERLQEGDLSDLQRHFFVKQVFKNLNAAPGFLRTVEVEEEFAELVSKCDAKIWSECDPEIKSALDLLKVRIPG